MYILQIENLYKKYDKTEVINNVSFSIKEGEIYGLLGPNGAGKSTIIKLIAGIEQLDKGKIIFEEKETNVNKYKKNLGIVAQDIALYPNFTAYENISFFVSILTTSPFLSDIKAVESAVGAERTFAAELITTFLMSWDI